MTIDATRTGRNSVTPRGLPSSGLRVSPRRELRYALLAAMETCWVTITLVFFAANMGAPRVLSAFSILVAYWIALLAGRLLPRVRRSWTVLQAAAIVLALATAILLIRAEFYAGVAPWDASWFPQYIASLTNFSKGFPADLLATFAVIYVFVRGLGFGQRPLTLWFIGFQFRLGVVVFFAVLVLAGLTKPIQAGAWISVYFFVSLVAIALARMEEAAGGIPLAPPWVGMLLGIVALVVFLGLGLHELFTLDMVDRIVNLIRIPVSVVAGAIFLLLLIFGGIIAGWIVDLLRPVFEAAHLDQIFQNLLPPGLSQNSDQAPQQIPLLDELVPILKVVFVAALVVGVGVILARALNRRMGQIEEETFVREAAGPDEEQVRSRRRQKPVAPKTPRSDLSAESVRRVYAALVTRAAEAGVSRQPAETPFEFLPRLKKTFPEGQEPIEEITQAYVGVHYGEHPASLAEVSAVRRAWSLVEHIIARKR